VNSRCGFYRPFVHFDRFQRTLVEIGKLCFCDVVDHRDIAQLFVELFYFFSQPRSLRSAGLEEIPKFGMVKFERLIMDRLHSQ